MQRKRKRIKPKAKADAEADQSSKHIIPADVIKDILIWLPARTLSRLRCLSKEWFRFLTDPEFTTNHAVRTQSKVTTKYYKGDEFKLFSFLPETKSFHTLNPEIGFRNNIYNNAASLPWKPNRDCSPIGSYNGLICLMQPYKSIHEAYILINPMTREFFEVKYFRDGSNNLKPKPEYQYGFGYDLFTQDYKIVRIGSYFYPRYSYRVDIFSLKNKCWSSIVEDDRTPTFPYFYPRHMAAHVGGVLHWRCYRFPGNNIFTFDLATNKCGVLYGIPGDELIGSSHMNIVAVSVFQGCLCVTRSTVAAGYGYTIWMMKEYGVEESWTKFISINLGLSFDRNNLILPRPICFANEGKGRLLLFQDGDREFFSYKLEDGSLRLCQGPEKFSHTKMMVAYTESLISPKLL